MAWQQTTAAQLETIAAQQRLLLEAVRDPSTMRGAEAARRPETGQS